MTIANELAQRIVAMRYQDLPADAVEWAKISCVDMIGCALAASDEQCWAIAARVLTAGKGAGPSLIWGTTQRVSALDAAEVNGTAAHALDYDDCSSSLGGHPTAAVMPAVLALGEMLGSTGKDVLLAYVTGFETLAHVAYVMNMHHYDKGWHPTATLGIFGATAASARLLGLNVDQTATALAIAVSLSAGVKANFGTMTKPLHAGQCTRHGAYAALLAREGFTASPEAFEHHHGFFEVFNGKGNYDASKIVAHWADPLDILNPGAGLKQYPCCAGTHSAIDAMLTLRAKHGLTPDKVASVESTTHARVLAHTNRPDPRSLLDAKFSVQYCIARALMHGEVGFSHFEGDSYRDPEVRKLLSRIQARPHKHEPKGMADSFECEMTVTATDGKKYTARVDQPLRGPTNLTPPDRLESKFNDCAARALRPDAVLRLYKAIRGMDTMTNVRELTDLMATSLKPAERLRASA